MAPSDLDMNIHIVTVMIRFKVYISSESELHTFRARSVPELIQSEIFAIGGGVYFTERNGTERNGTQGYFTERTSVITKRLI